MMGSLASSGYPLKFFDSIYENASSEEEAFINYLEKEKAPIVYSYNCEIYQDDSFQGNPEPGKPAMLLAFLTYKRSRLQIIIQTFEFEKKVFMLSEPVREDLKWRKQYLEIANYDLIQKCNRDIELVETLYPSKVIETLENRSYKSHDYAKYNLMLAPLGSKMQTVGAYFFWRKHPEISVLFSSPKEFFKDSYSKSYKDTFLYCYNDD